jgi:hypothetical protein
MALKMTSNSYSTADTDDANSYCITTPSSYYYDDGENMIGTAAARLRPSYYRMLDSILPRENALTIAKYIAT